MADVTITAANVAKSSNAVTRVGTAGVSLTAGQAIYIDPADNKAKLADCNAAAAEAKILAGITLHAAAAGQPIVYQESGDVVIGGTVAAGKVYVLSGTAGGIAPIADLTTGDVLNIVGYGINATTIRMALNATGIATA